MKIKVSAGLVLKIALAVAITLAVGLLSLYLLFYLKAFRFVTREVKRGHQRQVRLLCETDHKALLEACREISRQVTRGDLKKSYYRVRINPDPEISRLPQLILNLEPTYVEIYPDGHVMVELFGGFLHYGVMAYPEDYRYDAHLWYGDKQLIPGLWYFDDAYRDEYPRHKKKIDALIQKGKMRRPGKRA